MKQIPERKALHKERSRSLYRIESVGVSSSGKELSEGCNLNIYPEITQAL